MQLLVRCILWAAPQTEDVHHKYLHFQLDFKLRGHKLNII